MELIKAEFEKIMLYIKDNPGFGYDIISEITRHICISSINMINQIRDIQSRDIKNILNLSPILIDKKIRKRYKKHEIAYVHYPMPLNYKNFYQELYEHIHETVRNGEKILICCEKGNDKSPTVVINYLLRRMYLMEYNKKSPKEMKKTLKKFKLLDIIKFIKNVRSCTLLSNEYVQQLLFIESQIKGQLMEFLGEESSDSSSDESSSLEYFDSVEDFRNSLYIINDELKQ